MGASACQMPTATVTHWQALSDADSPSRSRSLGGLLPPPRARSPGSCSPSANIGTNLSVPDSDAARRRSSSCRRRPAAPRTVTGSFKFKRLLGSQPMRLESQRIAGSGLSAASAGLLSRFPVLLPLPQFSISSQLIRLLPPWAETREGPTIEASQCTYPSRPKARLGH